MLLCDESATAKRGLMRMPPGMRTAGKNIIVLFILLEGNESCRRCVSGFSVLFSAGIESLESSKIHASFMLQMFPVKFFSVCSD